MNPSLDASRSPTSAEAAVPGMDPAAVERWERRQVHVSPWLHEEVGSRMAQRLAWIKAQPSAWMSWEPVHAGIQAHRTVAATYPKARVLVQSRWVEHTLSALKDAAPESAGLMGRWRYTAPSLADDRASVDMLWANMALHTTHLPQTMLRRWHASLKPDGFLMFSCLGPDSLAEIRRVYALLGWPAPTHAFTDMHDWGDMLVQAGFAEPVMDMERITLSYSSSSAMLDELRSLGGNLSSARAVGSRGRQWLAGWHSAMEEHLPRASDGRLLLTFEVIYGHAFKGETRIPVAKTSAVPLESMRTMLGTQRRSTIRQINKPSI
jgi:malonyl-CoA O-methyltransferase